MASQDGLIYKSTSEAMDRVLSRLIGFQQGYNVILTAMLEAHKGHQKLSNAFSRLDESLKSSGINSKNYFLSILFLDSISEMEIFFSSVVKAVISQYPRKLGSSTFTLIEVMDAKNVDELATKAADEFINKLMYKKPLEYLDSICEVLSIDKEPIIPLWPSYIEAKARRDLGVHNGWICNSTYLRKMQEANIQTSVKEGELMIPSSTGYSDTLGDNFIEIVKHISEQLAEKYP